MAGGLPPTLCRQFFYVPRCCLTLREGYETESTVYRPYPRRPESQISDEIIKEALSPQLFLRRRPF